VSLRSKLGWGWRRLRRGRAFAPAPSGYRPVKVVPSSRRGGRAIGRRRGNDLILVAPDVELTAAELDVLQNAAYAGDDQARGAVCAREVEPGGTVRSVGLFHDPHAPDAFDERYRGRSVGDGAASAMVPVLAASGACLYLRRDAIEEAGGLDPSASAADACLRLWRAGRRVVAWPEISVTRTAPSAGPEVAPQWRKWLADRAVRSADGRLRIVYVTQDTGVGGGHRVIFEHCNGLAARGHDVALWSLGSPPDWFDLQVPVRTFDGYGPLEAALEPLRAIKVASWWETARPVWLASVRHGIGAHFVQDIETSYYPNDEWHWGTILASYREELRTFTTSGWNRDRLAGLGLSADAVPPGVDLKQFRELPDVRCRDDLILALGRSQPLKNLPLTLEAAERVNGAELLLFGSEPHLGGERGVGYVERPSDEEVNRLLNQAAVFVQTSHHEGFCLPPLEAMAAGCPVVCTDAHGNRDYCVDGENCLMPEPTPDAVADAIRRALHDDRLRARLVTGGRRTAADYGWEARIDALERFLEEITTTLHAHAGDRHPAADRS
jgi:glycosyltransferase involved in cell wall biosynthesis